MEQLSLIQRVKRRLALVHGVLIDVLHLPLRRRRPDPYYEVFSQFVTLVEGLPALDRPLHVEAFHRAPQPLCEVVIAE